MENLVVVSKQVAQIEWNKEQALQEAKDIMAKYEGVVFDEEQLPLAKKEVATLRKVAKEINAQALAIDKELTAPVKQFRNEVKEVKAIIDNGITHIDEQIKDFEFEQAKLRMYEILSFDEYEALGSFVQYDSSWGLKKWTDKKLKELFVSMKDEIDRGINTIKSTCTMAKLDSEFYINMFKTNELDKVIERITEDVENLKKSSEQSVEIVEVKKEDELITIHRTITGTESQLIALKQYALKLGVVYQ